MKMRIYRIPTDQVMELEHGVHLLTRIDDTNPTYLNQPDQPEANEAAWVNYLDANYPLTIEVPEGILNHLKAEAPTLGTPAAAYGEDWYIVLVIGTAWYLYHRQGDQEVRFNRTNAALSSIVLEKMRVNHVTYW